MKIRHLILDWSGTLYDDHRVSYRATRDVIRHFSSRDISLVEYKNHFTLPAEKFYRKYISQKIPFTEINHWYFENFQKYFRRGRLFPGVHELLRACRREGVMVSVFSTVRQDMLDEACRVTGILKYFACIQGSVIDKRRELKSHLREVGAKNLSTVFVGDTYHDIDAANQNGIISACVLDGYQLAERLLPRQPRLVFRNLQDLIPLIKNQGQIPPRKDPPVRPLATVGALVMNRVGEGLFVLTPKWGFTYGIPGGKIDRGETALHALKREMLEETGLAVRPEKFLMVQDCIHSKEFYIPKSHMLLMNWVARAPSSRVKLNDEALSYVWLKPSLALHLPLNQPTRVLVEAYQKSLARRGEYCTMS